MPPRKRPAADPFPTPASRSGIAYPRAVETLIDRFAELPGIGRRSAERLALHVLREDAPRAKALAQAILDVKQHVRQCTQCGHLADADLCGVCADDRRDRGLVLVVEQPRDVLALEATGMYKGLYHVLMGRLSPLEGIGPADLTIAKLLRRCTHPEGNAGAAPVREVILGLNPTLEGDGTALYLEQELRPLSVKVSRLARGLPSGGSLEHASKAVLADAIVHRT